MFVTLLRICAVALCFCASSIMLQAQSIEWQRLHGIQGSYITAITKTSSGAIFVGTPYGIWRTRDTLRTWENVSVGLRDSLIYALAATSDGALLAGTYTGVYRTTDDGKTWSVATPSGTVRYWQYLYAHPNGTCFASSRKKLFRSTNNGKTWAAFADSIVNVEPFIETNKLRVPVAMIGTNGRISIGAQHYSDDNGKTWQKTLSSDNYHVKALTQIDDNSAIIGSCNGNGIKVTNDGGKTWYESTDDELDLMEIDPEQKNEVNGQKALFYNSLNYFINGHLNACYAQFIGNNEMLYSIFGLGVWKVKTRLSTEPNNYSYGLIQKQNVTDNGVESRFTTALYKLNDSTFLLGSFGAGLFMSKNKGDTWSPIKNFPAQSPIITTFYNDDKRGTMYAGTVNGLYKSSDHGIEWQRIDSGFYYPHVYAVTVTGKGTLIATSFNRCFRKELGSKVWEKIETLSHNVYSVIHLASSGDSVFAVKGRLFYSVDDGKTFQQVNNVIFGDYGYGGATYMLGYYKNSLICYGIDGVNHTTKGLQGWNKRVNTRLFDYEKAVNPYSNLYVSRNYSGHVSRFTGSVYLSAGYGLTSYDRENNVITERNAKDEWLYGEFVLGMMSDQKGRPFAATMEGIAFSEKADKNWKFTPPLPGLSIPAMKEVEVDDKGYLYAASLFGGVFRSKEPIIALSSPSLTLPINKAQEVALTTQLKWTAANDAKNYGLQIATDSLFTTIIFEDSSATALLYGELPLKPNTKYFWRVQSRLFGVRSPWSEIRSFSTLTVYPSKVTLRQPANKEINRPVSVSLLWNPTTEADSFDVHVASDNAFTMTALRDSMIAKREIQLNNLQQGTEYFWRVRGKNRAGYGPWSETWSFTTQSPSGISEDDNSGMSVTVQNSHVILHYGAYSQSVKGIRITDIRGKTILSQTIEQGQSSSDFDMSGMSKGYYVVILDTHTGSISRNIIME